MNARELSAGIYWMGAVDWDRRLFDALIPLPDGTSYNAYLIQGSEKTVLLDSVDPNTSNALLSKLENVPNVDYVIAHHAEQDHSGTIPTVLEKYKLAKVITTPSGKGIFMDLLGIPEDRFIPVQDGETLSLGDKTLKFIHLPWVHWPETMGTYLQEDHILFSCDFFGSHIASSDLFATDEARVYEAAKRYYAEIMMPHRKIIEKNLEKLKDYELAMIAPSHGPIHNRPAFIIEAYRDWVLGKPKNIVVLPFISMHGSTEKMVAYFSDALVDRGIAVELFNLAVTDIGKLAMALVDAATIVIGTPTVLGGAHPNVVHATYLANALKPKTKFASVIGSYSWGGRTVKQIADMIPNLAVELLDPVLCKGFPKEADLKALENLAATVAQKHQELSLA
jgi:flavorubredoxin